MNASPPSAVLAPQTSATLQPIPKYQGIVVATLPSTGLFALAGARHTLAPLLYDAKVHCCERQECRHPEAHLCPLTPMSALELLELDRPYVIQGTKTQWVIAHWNETTQCERLNAPWEGFQLFFQYGESDAREQYSNCHKLWKQHGYFCLPQYDDYVQQKARQKMRAMKARVNVARKVVAPTPVQPPGNGVMGLLKAQLAVLEPCMPRTVQAMRAKNHALSIAAFEFESQFPLFRNKDEEIDFMIVRAYARQGPLPTDDEIARELLAMGLPRLSRGAIKQRRFKLELFGRNPGPKPRPFSIG